MLKKLISEQLNENKLSCSNVVNHNSVTIKYDEVRLIDKGDGTISQEFLFQGKKICYRDIKGKFPGITIDF